MTTDLAKDLASVANDRVKFIEKLDETAGLLTRGAIYSIYGYAMSIRYGTPQMVVAYMRLGAILGIAGCYFSVAKKALNGELDLTKNKPLQAEI